MRRNAKLFTFAARVAAAGQRYRVDEPPSMTALTVRFLAQREADRLSHRMARSDRWRHAAR